MIHVYHIHLRWRRFFSLSHFCLWRTQSSFGKVFNTGLSGSQARPKGAFNSQDSPDPQSSLPRRERNHQSSSHRGIWSSFKIKNPENQSQKILIPVPQIPIQVKTFLTCFSRSWAVRIYLNTNDTPGLSFSLPKCSPKTQAYLLTFLGYIHTTSYHGALGSQWYLDPHCLSNTPYLGQILILWRALLLSPNNCLYLK